MSNIIEGITKDLKAIPKNLKAKAGGMDTKKLVLLNLPYIFAGYFCDKVAWLWRVSEGTNASDRMMAVMNRFDKLFANPLKAQYELQCEKDHTDDKKELLEAKRRMMDLDDLIKGLYENFTLGRLPERQFNRLMTEYDTEQSNLEQKISELETATERIYTKTVQIDRFVRLVKK